MKSQIQTGPERIMSTAKVARRPLNVSGHWQIRRRCTCHPYKPRSQRVRPSERRASCTCFAPRCEFRQKKKRALQLNAQLTGCHWAGRGRERRSIRSEYENAVVEIRSRSSFNVRLFQVATFLARGMLACEKKRRQRPHVTLLSSKGSPKLSVYSDAVPSQVPRIHPQLSLSRSSYPPGWCEEFTNKPPRPG